MDAQSFAGLVLQWLVRDDVVEAARAIINVLNRYGAGFPRVIRLAVLVVARLSHDLVVHRLEGARLLWRLERHIVSDVSRKSFGRNAKFATLNFTFCIQTQSVSVSSRAERNLSLRNLDRSFLFMLFLVVASHVDVLERVIFDEVGVATVGVAACACDLRSTEPVKRSHWLYCTRCNLHLVWLRHFILFNS